MGKTTNIAWATATVNFWVGCKKVSAGCKNCYMYRDMERYGKEPATVKRTLNSTFYQAVNWTEPQRIFTCSWSDFFIAEADVWRTSAWEVIKKTPQHTWLILTKRPERILAGLPEDWGPEGYPNVWLGVSVADAAEVARVPALLAVPAVCRFVSVEPLLADISDVFMFPQLDWVILGGESGNDNGKHGYRPCNYNWLQTLVVRYGWYGVPVFVKQVGTALAKELGLRDRKGADPEEWPPAIQTQLIPTAEEIARRRARQLTQQYADTYIHWRRVPPS